MCSDAFGPARDTILDKIAASARGKNAQAETRQILIPDDMIGAGGLYGINEALVELGHAAVLTRFSPRFRGSTAEAVGGQFTVRAA